MIRHKNRHIVLEYTKRTGVDALSLRRRKRRVVRFSSFLAPFGTTFSREAALSW